MKTVAIWNNKGGSGKTTTAYNTAYALGCELGRSVLLVDLDKQASLSHWFEHDPATGETVADASFVQNRGIANVLVPGECGRRLEVEEAAFPTGWEGVGIVPSSEAFARHCSNEKLPNHARLAIALSKMSKRPDYVLIDCPSQIDNEVRNACVAADLVIAPTMFGGDHEERLIKSIRSVREEREGMDMEPCPIKVLAIAVRERTTNDTEGLANLREALGDMMLETYIRDSVKADEAANRKVGVGEAWAANNVAVDYLSLAREIEGEVAR